MRRPLPCATIAALLALACQSTQGAYSVPAYVVRERMRDVELGQSLDDVHGILKRDPVRKPGHPEDPFPTPLHVVELRTPEERHVRVETYVVATGPAKGCPDFRYEDVPVVFLDGEVTGTDWEFVEWNWRRWGGGLARLRAIQDRNRCPEIAG